MERKIAINNSTITLESTWAAMQNLSEKEQFEILKLLMNYSFYEEEIKTDNPLVNMVILQALPNLNGARQRYNKAVKNGKKGGRPVQYDTETIVKLTKSGYTQSQVAQELGCSIGTVKTTLRNFRNGVSEPLTNDITDDAPMFGMDKVKEQAQVIKTEKQLSDWQKDDDDNDGLPF